MLMEMPKPLEGDELKNVIENLDKPEMVDLMITTNLRLVMHIAKKYGNTGHRVDDLFSIGCIGLVKGAKTFNAEKNAKFATYSSRCIENEILMFIRRNKKHSSDISLHAPLNTDWEGNELTVEDTLIALDTDPDRAIIENDEKYLQILAIGIWLLPKPRHHVAFVFNRASGMTQTDSATSEGMSQSYGSRIIQGAAIQCRKILTEIEKKGGIQKVYTKETIEAAILLIQGGDVPIQKPVRIGTTHKAKNAKEQDQCYPKKEQNLVSKTKEENQMHGTYGTGTNNKRMTEPVRNTLSNEIPTYAKPTVTIQKGVLDKTENTSVPAWLVKAKTTEAGTMLRLKKVNNLPHAHNFPSISINKRGVSVNTLMVNKIGWKRGQKIDMTFNKISDDEGVLTFTPNEAGQVALRPSNASSKNLGIYGKQLMKWINENGIQSKQYSEFYNEGLKLYVKVDIV